MTSTCASSEMTASFEDLSSLSSDKDIESLILATTYDDDDLCASNNNNNKSHKSTNETASKGENNDKAEIIDNTSEVSGTAEKAEEEEVDDMEEYDFVNLVLEREEDEADVLSEGWESSRSASPEPQQGDQRVFTSLPDAQSLENYQGHSSLPQTILQEDIYTSNSKEDSPAAESTEPNSNTASMIPKLRMTRDIYAVLQNLALPSSTSTPIPSVLLPQPAQSPAPQRMVATPSRIRLIRTQPPSSTVTPFIPTPDNGSSSSPYQGKKNSPELKKAIRITAYPCILRPINTTTTTTVTKANDVPMMTPPLAAAPEQVQVQVDKQKEESMDVCKAIRRSTGERCTRLGRHTGYCQTHCLMVP
ncbi:hypothetical protein BGX24_002939, partial [Mortierella sp. AD032]